KTRLAIEVGSSLIGTFDGVGMVALEEESSADLVASSIASSLGVPSHRAVCPPPPSPSSFRLQSRQELWRWALFMPRPVIVAFAGDQVGVGHTVLGSWRWPEVADHDQPTTAESIRADHRR